MDVSFSTICPNYAKRYLFESGKYDFLTLSAKEYVMQNLGEIRVQDPMMYKNPQVVMTSREHYNKVMELNKNKGE